MADTAATLERRPEPPRAAAALSAAEHPWWTLPPIPPWAIIAGAVAVSAAVGRFLADGRLKYAVALVLGSVYGPVVFFDLPVALAMWTGVQYIKDLRFLSVGPNTMGVLIALAFLGPFAARARTLPVLRQQRQLILATILFALWLTLSIAWARQPGTAASGTAYWWLGALTMLVVMTTLSSARSIGLVALAFVGGAAVAALIGLATGGLSTAAANATSAASQTAVQGRLTGGGGDPNLQAAGFVAAMFLAAGVLGIYRRRVARIALTGSFVVITVAFVATESRGGLLALAAAALAAFVISPEQRRRIVVLTVLVVAIAGVAALGSPGALSRITNLGGGTSGRTDIWSVATKVFEQHPLIGVGTDNFKVVEPRFALMHRTVSRVSYIAETPFPAHNTYLQLLAEDGIIGLAAYLAVICLSLRAAWRAARIFDRIGRRAHASLSRAMLMGTVGMLAATFFITAGDDSRLWILFGLGPALLALAYREAARDAAPEARRPPA